MAKSSYLIPSGSGVSKRVCIANCGMTRPHRYLRASQRDVTGLLAGYAKEVLAGGRKTGIQHA